MKNKAQASLQMLEQALAHMPGDNALGTARSYVSRAIEEIARVETKRERRVQQATIQSRQWSYNAEFGKLVAPMTEPQKKAVLGHIDNLIEDEKKKIDKLKDSGPDLTLFN